MANIQALLSCLDVFSRAPDKASLEAANTWLQDFQHSVNLPFTFWSDLTTTASDSTPNGRVI